MASQGGSAMAKRVEYVSKRVPEILEDLVQGHREAAFHGPDAARRYLLRTLEGQESLPRAVRTPLFDRLAEAEALRQDWEACAAAVDQALSHLGDLEAEFPHTYRRQLEELVSFERGIQALGELGRFAEALSLARRAVALGLGAHYQAKADSLAWAE